MEKQYNHLTLAERDQITIMLYEGRGMSEIAKTLGRDKSTISRELSRNSSPEYKKYLSHRAHARANERRTTASRRPRLKNDLIRAYVKEKLTLGWSPELIAGRIRIDHSEYSISHEAIYQYIYHPQTEDRLEMIKSLRRGHRKRKKKGIGRKERKTKLVRKGAQETKDAVINRLKRLPARARKSLTMDNGTENAQHEDITANIGIKCFFAHPYSSWERGTNEHINGIIRWYLPKGTDFSKISEQEIAQIESLINNRPRKCLGFKTPLEVASPFVALQG